MNCSAGWAKTKWSWCVWHFLVSTD